MPNRRIKGYPGGGASPYKAILLLVIFQKIKNDEPDFTDGIIRYSKCVEGFDRLYRGIFGIKYMKRSFSRFGILVLENHNFGDSCLTTMNPMNCLSEYWSGGRLRT